MGKNQQAITRQGIVAELCRRSFWFFVKEFWEEADTSTPVWNWHMKYIADSLEEDGLRIVNNQPKKNDIIINCPPGTSKSMIVSVLWPAWLLTVKPSIRIISASYSNTVALELSIKTRNLLMGDKYRVLFPEIRIKDDESSKGHYKTTQLGGRLTTSTGSNIIGMHADVIICDDVQNLATTMSETERRRVNSWVTGTLSTRKTDKLNSLMVFVQQRLHPQDVTSYLLSLGGSYKHLVLPAFWNEVATLDTKPFYDKNGGYLDPNRLSQKHLDEVKKMLGSANYNSQIQQVPQSESDSIIKRDWLTIVDELPHTDSYFYFLDTAYGGDGSDYSVILECFKKNNNLYITNVVRSQEEFPELLKKIKDLISVQKAQKVYIESKASGKSIISTLRRQTKLNIVELNPKDSKLVRLNAVAPTVEGQRVFLKRAAWNETLIDEVTSNYPKNDDVRDCFTYAVNEILIKEENYGQYIIG